MLSSLTVLGHWQLVVPANPNILTSAPRAMTLQKSLSRLLHDRDVPTARLLNSVSQEKQSAVKPAVSTAWREKPVPCGAIKNIWVISFYDYSIGLPFKYTAVSALLLASQSSNNFLCRFWRPATFSTFVWTEVCGSFRRSCPSSQRNFSRWSLGPSFGIS